MTMAHTYSIVVFGGIVSFISAACGPFNTGSTECVRLPGYNVPQYATCLTDTYIYLKSGGEHGCVNAITRMRLRGDTCWYQCMCERNNECDGPGVYGNCACDPNDPKTKPDRITLPSWCFSPSGQQCSWYMQCFKKRYPCKGTDVASAITYAKTFCELYDYHNQDFSMDGQRWIDAFRKCLQVELVPTLRPYAHESCDDIRKMAFASHTKCHLSPATNVSFCSLDGSDKWKLFWTVKGAFTGAFEETMTELRDAVYECITSNNETISYENSDIALIQIYVRGRGSMDQGPDVFAGITIDAIAVKEKWEERGLAWFAYSGDSERRERQVTPPPFRIDILLGSRKKYYLNTPRAPAVNMTEAVSAFANSVEKGIAVRTVNGVCVKVVYMKVCDELSCNSTDMEVEVNGTVTCTRSDQDDHGEGRRPDNNPNNQNRESDQDNRGRGRRPGNNHNSGSVFRVSLLFVAFVGITAITQACY